MAKTPKAVFVPVDSLHPGPTLYDLTVDRRVREYDVEEHDLQGALRRARLPVDTEIYIEDQSGYKTRLK